MIELHRHLEGAIRPQTVLDLLRLHNVTLPNREPLDEYHLYPLLRVNRPDPDIMTFISKLDIAITALSDLDACRRVAYESIEAAQWDNIRYMELRFSPLYMAGPHGLHPEGVVEAVIDGVKTGERDFGVRTNLIGILSRTFGVNACERELAALLSQKDHIIALDLAGDEINHPPQDFIELFVRARDAGWRVTVHAGEVDDAASIWRAIHLLGAERIGHALHAVNDPELLTYMATHRVGIESCLRSNVLTTSVPDFRSHPISKFLAHGIPVAICTDDPEIGITDLSWELNISAKKAGLTDEQITQTQRDAIEMAFLSQEEKQEILYQR